jgi:hypothetical protein
MLSKIVLKFSNHNAVLVKHFLFLADMVFFLVKSNFVSYACFRLHTTDSFHVTGV